MDQYGSRGFQVLCFPSNQFGAQEPGSHEDILNNVSEIVPDPAQKFVFFEKADVNGANAREVYSFLKRELPSSDGTKDIRWNFGE